MIIWNYHFARNVTFIFHKKYGVTWKRWNRDFITVPHRLIYINFVHILAQKFFKYNLEKRLTAQCCTIISCYHSCLLFLVFFKYLARLNFKTMEKWKPPQMNVLSNLLFWAAYKKVSLKNRLWSILLFGKNIKETVTVVTNFPRWTYFS